MRSSGVCKKQADERIGNGTLELFARPATFLPGMPHRHTSRQEAKLGLLRQKHQRVFKWMARFQTNKLGLGGRAVPVAESQQIVAQSSPLALATRNWSLSSCLSRSSMRWRSRLKATRSSPLSTLPTGKRTRIASTLVPLTINS